MANVKLSQIVAAGAPPAVTDTAVFVTGGNTDNLVTVTQLAAGLPAFTSTLRGSVPASGGGTTNFLRADGTWATPPAGAPGGSSLQIQYNNAGAFGGANVWRTGANQLDLSNGAATAQQLRVYNSTDNNGGAPTNAEWAVFDWTTTTNVLTVGMQKSGTGNFRNINIDSGSVINLQAQGGTLGPTVQMISGTGVPGILMIPAGCMRGDPSTPLTFSASTNVTGGSDSGVGRIAAKVLGFNDGPFGSNNTNGWMQWQGQARIDADFNTGNSTVLTNITGSSKNLSVTLQAGRTYSFRVELFTTSNVAAGVQFAIAGTCTATNIIYEALVDDAAAVKAQTKATALATAVGAVTAVTSAHCNITGTITVNAGGTLVVQAAQNVGNATGTVVQRGSYMIVQDMP